MGALALFQSIIGRSRGAVRVMLIVSVVVTASSVFVNGAHQVVAAEVDESATKFVPVQPCRVVDTRESSPLAGASSVDVTIAGRCGVSPDATAVAATIAVIDPVAEGFATMWPAGSERPATSTVNHGPRQVVANSQLVALGDGAVSVYSLVTTHMILDVTGYFVPVDEPTRSGRYVPITATRALDTRLGTRPAADGTVRVDLGLPSGASAAMVTITVVADTGPDFVTVFPAGTQRPLASVVNIDRVRQVRAGTTIVPLSPGGIDVYTLAGSHLVIDVSGYFTGSAADAATDGLFVPIIPERLVDTRAAAGPNGGPRLWDGGRREFDVSGSTDDWAAIVANVVATDTEDAGFLTVGPARAGVTGTSNVGYSSAQLTVANQAVVPLAEHGFDVYALSSTHVVVDMTGWFTGERVVTSGPAPANPLPPQRRVTVIGDSALAGLEWNNAEGSLLGFDPHLELASCRRLARPSCRGRDGIRPTHAVDVIRSLPQPTSEDILVVGAGYDDWHEGFSEDFDAVVGAARARGFHHIAFTTFRSGVSYVFVGRGFQTNYAQINDVMRAKLATGDYPDVRIWDFDSYSASAPLNASGWFYADGVHHRTRGSWGTGDWLSRHVAAFDDRPCPMPWRPGLAADAVCPNPDYLPQTIGLPDIAGLYGT